MRLLVVTQAVDRDDPVLGFFHRWLEEFATHCTELHVICLKEGTHALPENVKVHSLGKENGVSRVKYVTRFFVYILKYRSRYDAVFVHMNPEYTILGWPIWKLMGKRRVLWYTHKRVTLKLRIGSRLVNAIFTASPESFRLVRPNVVVTGHGIDTSVFTHERPHAQECLRLITCGRITSSKGLMTILEAVRELPKHGVSYQLLIVGAPVTREDEKYEAELHSFVQKNNLERFVTFAGPKSNEEIPKLLAVSDVMLHASTTGSLDKAMLEAMAAGCIVISSNDAAKSILANIHADCVVAEPRPELFVHSITNVYRRGQDERAVLGTRSRAVIERDHALHTLIERLISILENK